MKSILNLFSLRRMVVTVTVLVSVRVYLELSDILYGKHSYNVLNDAESGENIALFDKTHFNVVQRRIRHIDRKSKLNHCDISDNWTLLNNLPKMSTDWNSWTYNEIIKCPKLYISNGTKQNNFIHIKCETIEIIYGKKVQTVDHESDCLDYYIKQCCTDTMAVPNIVHYIWYGLHRKFSFYGFLSFISVLRFVRPCVILMHGDNLPNGSYWNFISNIYPNIIQVKREVKPDLIFGKKTKMLNHASDVIRIEALLKYGGIYLDMDMVLVKDIDFLRKHPCTMSRSRQDVMGSSFIMAERNASFLHKWLEEYKYNYRNDSYIYNAMLYPSLLVYNYSNLIHVESETLSRPWALHGDKLYRNIAYNWSHLLGCHFYSKLYRKRVDKNRIKQLNSTFGAIARHILYGNKELCSD